MQSKLWPAVAALAAAGWFGWHVVEFRRCGDRICAPGLDEPALQIASGRKVHVLATGSNGRGALTIEYLTGIDRENRGELCSEAKAVWRAATEAMDMRRVERAELQPTSPESEFLGMRYLVVPLYTCCVTTPLGVRKDVAGAWSFPDCPRE